MTLEEMRKLADQYPPVGPRDYRMNAATWAQLKSQCIVVEDRPLATKWRFNAVTIWIDPSLRDGDVRPGQR
jgi:hypothetical protein